MGEIADMMLDGTLCSGCGVYMGDDLGYPGYCSGCAPDYVEQPRVKKKTPAQIARRKRKRVKARERKAKLKETPHA